MMYVDMSLKCSIHVMLCSQCIIPGKSDIDISDLGMYHATQWSIAIVDMNAKWPRI